MVAASSPLCCVLGRTSPGLRASACLFVQPFVSAELWLRHETGREQQEGRNAAMPYMQHADGLVPAYELCQLWGCCRLKCAHVHARVVHAVRTVNLTGVTHVAYAFAWVSCKLVLFHFMILTILSSISLQILPACLSACATVRSRRLD